MHGWGMEKGRERVGGGGGVGSNGFDPGQPAGQKPVDPSRSGCGEAVHVPRLCGPGNAVQDRPWARLGGSLLLSFWDGRLEVDGAGGSLGCLLPPWSRGGGGKRRLRICWGLRRPAGLPPAPCHGSSGPQRHVGLRGFLRGVHHPLQVGDTDGARGPAVPPLCHFTVGTAEDLGAPEEGVVTTTASTCDGASGPKRRDCVREKRERGGRGGGERARWKVRGSERTAPRHMCVESSK